MNATLVLGGRSLPGATQDIRRYCGMPWSGGPPEVWAYQYFDAVPTEPDNEVRPQDVVTAAALHPGLSRSDLTFFVEQSDVLSRFLSATPPDVDLADADTGTLHALDRIPDLTQPGGAGLSLVTKVLHRKRPRLIPLLDRALVDWYRPVTGLRGEPAWPAIVAALRHDLSEPSNRIVVERITNELPAELTAVPSGLRLADIAVWMHGRA